MAPSTSTFDLYARQATNGEGGSTEDIPGCVTSCMSQGNTEGCAGPDDFGCLCLSTQYSESVALCWIGQCDSNQITVGMRYTGSICAAYTSGNSTASPTDVNGAPIDPTSVPITTGEPHIYIKSFVNVQAIMSSICATVLLIALVLGIVSCRARMRIEKEAADRSTWSGGATYAETKNGKSQIFSQTGTTKNRESLDPTLSFQTLGHAPGRIGVNRQHGFTNRMTNEEIEMSVQTSPSPSSSGSGGMTERIDEEVVTPTSLAFKIDHRDDEDGRDQGGFDPVGSTVELTPKNEQMEFKRGTAF